jgi:hypothetical protein
MPKTKFVADNAILDRMQKVRSPREIDHVPRRRPADQHRHAGGLSCRKAQA